MTSLSLLFAAVVLMAPHDEVGAQADRGGASPLSTLLSPTEWVPNAAQADEVDQALQFGEKRLKINQYQRIYAGNMVDDVRQIRVILTRSDYYALPKNILYRARFDERAQDQCGEYLAVYDLTKKALVSLTCTGR